jgi:hypothetical protein
METDFVGGANMMRTKFYRGGVFALAMCCGASANATGVQGIHGLWASEASACNKIFERKGGRASFTNNSDSFGSGLIIEGGRLIGKMGRCVIRNTKREGDLFHLFAACSTDISQENLQVRLRLVNADKMIRIFPDIPEMETEYVLCPQR